MPSNPGYQSPYYKPSVLQVLAKEPFYLCTAKVPIPSEVNSMGKDTATLPPSMDNEDCISAVTCGLRIIVVGIELRFGCNWYTDDLGQHYWRGWLSGLAETYSQWCVLL